MMLPERLLWNLLKQRGEDGIVFRRQYPFENYIFDFYCAKAELIIEIDGLVHAIGNNPQRDAARDEYLTSLWFKVWRIEAKEVLKNPIEIASNIRYFCYQIVWAKPPP